MKYFKFFNLKEFSIFFWLILIGIIGISISTIYSKNKSNEEEKIRSSLKNIYLLKTVKEITNNLKPRYTTSEYISKPGDTYQSIINQLEIYNK